MNCASAIQFLHGKKKKYGTKIKTQKCFARFFRQRETKTKKKEMTERERAIRFWTLKV